MGTKEDDEEEDTTTTTTMSSAFAMHAKTSAFTTGAARVLSSSNASSNRRRSTKIQKLTRSEALAQPTDKQQSGDGERENCRGHRLGWGRRFPFVPVDEDSIEASCAYWWVVSTHRCADAQLHQLRDQQSVHFEAI